MGSRDSNSKFKVLFVYPNFQMSHLLLPAGISILSAVLKKAGFMTRVFDTTLYKPAEKSFDDIRLEMLQLKRFTLGERSVHYKNTDIVRDFVDVLEEYKPNLVGASVLQDTFPIALPLMRQAKKRGYPVAVGGVYPTFAPDDVIKEECVDYVCIGEGENAIVELCRRMAEGISFNDTPNLWVKSADGTVTKNRIGPVMDINTLPYPDYDVFEEARFYRSMQGRVLRMLPVEMHRGCPYQCAFCEDPMLSNLYKSIGQRYHRTKSARRLIDEIKHIVETYQAEYIYFNAETFFAMPDSDFGEVATLYEKEVRLPCWLQTRPETITQRRVELLKKMNVAHINIGLEHGNEEFRKHVLKRPMRNELIVEGLSLLDTAGIPTTVNNIMGFPDETRELIFDTIELNRHIKSATVNAYLYNPYKGTKLYEVCKQRGYLAENTAEETVDTSLGENFPYFRTILNMPQISRKELCGLQRTFILYVKLPRDEFPRIRIAERFDEEGNHMFEVLKKEYLSGTYEEVSVVA